MFDAAKQEPLILLAEDEPDDQFFIRLGLKHAGLSNPLYVVRDGREAVDYLAGNGQFADRERFALPGLVILDLKMPRMNGFEVLAWIQARPEFSHIPVVVLSGSNVEADVARAKRLGAQDYLTKPAHPRILAELLLELHGRWLSGGTTLCSTFKDRAVDEGGSQAGTGLDGGYSAY